jgi:hypothetical protein
MEGALEKAEFEAEADRLIALARERGVVLRLLGAVAFARRCPNHAYLRERLGRHYTDIDFGAYGRQAREIQRMLAEAGYDEDPHVYVASEGSRIVAEHRGIGIHLDVFLDRLEFCHTVPWDGRLELDAETIPLAEMLLQKLQIVEINEKDLKDLVVLLLEHPVTEHGDQGSFDAAYVVDLLSRDWGFSYTVSLNLDRIRRYMDTIEGLTAEQRATVSSRIDELWGRVESAPKSLKWKLRARVGPSRKWYQEVGEGYRELGRESSAWEG